MENLRTRWDTKKKGMLKSLGSVQVHPKIGNAGLTKPSVDSLNIRHPLTCIAYLFPDVEQSRQRDHWPYVKVKNRVHIPWPFFR